jgi:uncharacterized protein YegL
MFDNFEMTRRTLTLFFLVDASEGMSGPRIRGLNTAMEELVPEIRKLGDQYHDVRIEVAVMKFSSGAAWITGPVEAEQFHWQDIQVSGPACLGAACGELNRKLSRTEFMKDPGGCLSPVIFLLSRGVPADDFDGGLAELKQNKWFKEAFKAAVVMGGDADKEALAAFTGSAEAIFEVHTTAMLKKTIADVAENMIERILYPPDTPANWRQAPKEYI